MHNMKLSKNKNLISDEQLLRFSDALASGASFDKAFADAGFFLSDQKAYAELQTYAALEAGLKSMNTSITPDAAFVEKLLSGLNTPPAALINEASTQVGMKSPYVGVFDRMFQMAARPTWKVAAPIAVMFLALSTILGVSARRDATAVLSPETLVTSSEIEPGLAMRSKTLNTNSVEAIPSTSTSANTNASDAPQGRTLLMQINTPSVNVADTTPETLDGIFASLEAETALELGTSSDIDADITLDARETSSLTEPYDETTI